MGYTDKIGKFITIIAMTILGAFFIYIGQLAFWDSIKLYEIFMTRIYEAPKVIIIPLVAITFAAGIITSAHEYLIIRNRGNFGN